MHRAQVALEFLMLSMLALLVMIVLLVLFGKIFSEKTHEATLQAMVDLGRSLQEETILAASVHSGYLRMILLPDRINNQPYTVETAASAVRLEIGSDSVTFATPPLVGTFIKGQNLLRNENGTVEVNS